MFSDDSQAVGSTKKLNTAFHIGYSDTSLCQGSNFQVYYNKLR